VLHQNFKKPVEQSERTQMKWVCNGLMAMIFGFFSIFILGCVTPERSFVKIENSLSQKELLYYNDSFDKLRGDLWDRAGYVRYEIQLENIKLADMLIDDGKLVIKTKTGEYSKGGLCSRYALRGDFDVQIDCHLDFFNKILNMDQLINFVVLDKASQIEQINLVTIGLMKKGEHLNSGVYMGCRKLGKYAKVSAKGIGDFRGSLRIVRVASEVSTFYKVRDEEDWRKMGSILFNANDVMVGFIASNFVVMRHGITASKPITAAFDNFRINAAQGTVEEEI
jgi:hypothetical protein